MILDLMLYRMFMHANRQRLGIYALAAYIGQFKFKLTSHHIVVAILPAKSQRAIIAAFRLLRLHPLLQHLAQTRVAIILPARPHDWMDVVPTLHWWPSRRLRHRSQHICKHVEFAAKAVRRQRRLDLLRRVCLLDLW